MMMTIALYMVDDDDDCNVHGDDVDNGHIVHASATYDTVLSRDGRTNQF